MKKTVYGVLIVAALLLTSVVFAQDKKAEQPKEQVKQAQPATTPAPDLKAKIPERTAGEQAPQAPGTRQGPRDRLAAEIAQLQEQQKAAAKELEDIRQLAVEEKAAKTADALKKLIEKRNAQFDQQIQSLQRRMKMFESATETKPGAQVQPPAEAKKGAEKAPAAEKKAQ
jgi:CHASE3 domain sensor protein